MPQPQRLLAFLTEATRRTAPLTADLPEEQLTLVFGLLGSGNRKRCSLIFHRWLAAEAASHLRLAHDARAPLLADSALPQLVARDKASQGIDGARPHQGRVGRRRPRTGGGAKFPRPRHGFGLERFGLYFHRIWEIGRMELHQWR
ncbi:unnamed protein product [Urochloa humidicola]